MEKSAQYWIQRLGLKPHPEGGYYNETYRSTESIDKKHLPTRFGSDHSYSTAIYFLLEGSQRSKFHRLKQDELWHFYYGSPLKVVFLDNKGYLDELVLGTDFDSGQRLQAVMPAGCWFGGYVIDQNPYSLVGCTVAPGFEFSDFELADRDELLSRYPEHEKEIIKLT